jgi:hypothetical protein
VPIRRRRADAYAAHPLRCARPAAARVALPSTKRYRAVDRSGRRDQTEPARAAKPRRGLDGLVLARLRPFFGRKTAPLKPRVWLLPMSGCCVATVAGLHEFGPLRKCGPSAANGMRPRRARARAAAKDATSATWLNRLDTSGTRSASRSSRTAIRRKAVDLAQVPELDVDGGRDVPRPLAADRLDWYEPPGSMFARSQNATKAVE